MEKEERRKYVFAQLESLPNAFQYVEVTQYIKYLETQLKKQKGIIDKTIETIDLAIELIKLDPKEDDSWTLDKLNEFKIILEDKEVK